MPRVYNFTDEDRTRSKEKEQVRRDRINSLPKMWGTDDKDQTMAAFDWCCGYCGAPEADVRLEFDHFVDIYVEDCPGTVPGNMVPSCRSCNRRKGNLGANSILTEEKIEKVISILTSLGGMW